MHGVADWLDGLMATAPAYPAPSSTTLAAPPTLAAPAPSAPAPLLFKDLRVWLAPDLSALVRTALTNSLRLFQATVETADVPTSLATHLVFEKLPSSSRLLRYSAAAPAALRVHREWASKCVLNKRVEPTAGHELSDAPPKKVARVEEDAQPEGVGAGAAGPANPLQLGAPPRGGSVQFRRVLACQPQDHRPRFDLNRAMRHIFTQLAGFELARGENWKTMTFYRVEGALACIQFEIDSEEALQAAAEQMGVSEGSSVMHVMRQVMQTGRSSRLEEELCRESAVAIRQLSRVWNVAHVQAEGLYNRGITNLDLLRKQVALDAAEGAPHRTLKAAQLIGLAHVDDFEKKIPRSEMETLFGLVRARALAILPGVKATAAGSFRRGAAFSGDLDVIFTHGDEDGGAEMVRELVRSLLADGVITAELKGGGRTDKGGVTWNGVIRLPAHLVPQGSERPPFRRLDLKFYPSQFYFYALLYFTGSDHFNRSMRYYADKWKRLSLSDWGLVVSGDKTYDGQEREKAAYTTSPPADCEEEIFRLLGLTYVPPEKRSV